MPTTLPPSWIAITLATGISMILVGVAVAIGVRRRLSVSWRWLGAGALAFFVAQPLTRIPLMGLLAAFARGWLEAPAHRTAVLLGASVTAGLFEELARWGVFRFLVKDRSSRAGIAVGAGHGALEALLLGGVIPILTIVQFAALLKLDTAHLALSSAQLAKVELVKQQIATSLAQPWYLHLLGAYERLGAIALHIALGLVVLRAFTRSPGWLAVAIAIHAGVDAIAVLLNQAHGALAAEGFLTVVAVACILFIVREHRRSVALAAPAPVP